jgi:hypothetical protein
LSSTLSAAASWQVMAFSVVFDMAQSRSTRAPRAGAPLHSPGPGRPR